MRQHLSEKAWVDLFTMEYEIEENYLWSICPTVPSKFYFMGKEIDNPRYDRVYGRDYTFSNVNHIAEPIPIELFPLLEYVNGLGYGVFDQMLINYYMNGHHYIGSHADNENQLVVGSPIVSISLGATRTFRIRDKDKKIVKDFELKNKDIIVMGGTMQKEFKHEIVKVNGQKGLNVGKRINITFRQFV